MKFSQLRISVIHIHKDRWTREYVFFSHTLNYGDNHKFEREKKKSKNLITVYSNFYIQHFPTDIITNMHHHY